MGEEEDEDEFEAIICIDMEESCLSTQKYHTSLALISLQLPWLLLAENGRRGMYI